MLKINQSILLSVFIALFSSVQAQTKSVLFSSVNERDMEYWVDSVFETMSVDERIGQLFMIVAPPDNTAKNINKIVGLIRDQKIGGILFQKGNPESQLLLTKRIQEEADIPLMVALDGEWGLSMRLKNTTQFPRNMMLGAVSDLKLIEAYGAEVARQCREMGIHVNFAPDIDVNSNPANPVIGTRSFGEDPEDVARKAIAYSKGLEREGVLSVAKHFPGHGDTDIDSHDALPVINRNRKELEEVELYPFRQYIKSGLSGIMTAHLDIPALGTKGMPGSLSKEVVTRLLRNDMGFEGLCFTDGLQMQSVLESDTKSIAVEALKAGNDVLVGPVNPAREFEAVKKAVKDKELKIKDLDERVRKILRYKYVLCIKNGLPLSSKNLLGRLNTPHADALNAALNAEALTLVKNTDNLLPIKYLDKVRIAAVSLGTGSDNEFQAVLKKYAQVDCFTLSDRSEAAARRDVFNKLSGYDLVIVGIHNGNIADSRDLQELSRNVNTVFVLFTTPYNCSSFQMSLESAQAVIIGYESTYYAQSYAAQLIFGGVAAKGALPVGISDLFAFGTGIQTEKTRLGYGSPEEAGLNPYRMNQIDDIVREGLEKEAYPGCQVLVVKDGMIVYDKTFGYLDYSKKQKVTDNTVYDLASVSKATGTLLSVMKSYDEGNFTLKEKISNYVKGLKGTDKEDITIRELLYHESGLPSTISFFEMAIDRNSFNGSLYSGRKDAAHPVRFDARTYVNPNFKYNPKNVSTSGKNGFTTKVANNFYVSNAFVNDSIIEGIRRARFGKSGNYVYSDVNFILLKMMVEQQTGEALDRFLDRNFFSRLGANSTTYNPLNKMDSTLIAPSEIDKFVRKQTVRGYVHDESAAFQGGVSGNAGLFSNANDLAKVMQLYLNNGVYGGERLLSTKTCRLFTGSKSPNSRRGLGFDKPDAKNPNNSPCGLLAPEAVYGHTGFTGTCFWIDPENNLFFIFLSNRTFPSRINSELFSLNIRTRIQDVIYKSLQ
ncbi:MAG: serine hydrolase [Tannerella sp.]|jgi:beta-glucosidase-like glycosyl hydrolase/CubicO group peptidase (beta-lactamase class C family)|nr:serine hydrolase [Tannerella sp.]